MLRTRCTLTGSHALPQARGVLHHHEYGPSVPATVHGAPRSAKACSTGAWPCVGRRVLVKYKQGRRMTDTRAPRSRKARRHSTACAAWPRSSRRTLMRWCAACSPALRPRLEKLRA